MPHVRVLVVGAGPAGSTVAFELARRGHEILLIEEHPNVGDPVQCAGLVSQRVLDLAGSSRRVRNAVRGAAVIGPSLRSLEFRAPEPRAFVIDRAGLDVDLADRATRAGARLETGTRFHRRLRSSTDEVVVELKAGDGSRREFTADIVVGADGVSSAVARAFRLRRPIEILPAFEAEFPTGAGDPDLVEVYLGRSISPGLFGWWIPDRSGGSRIGVAVTAGATTARQYYEALLRQIDRRRPASVGTPAKFLVSGIPIGDVPRTVGNRVLLVGDAAAQVKPISGGGIFTGMRCGQLAAEAIDAALRGGTSIGEALGSYERRWREEFGEEFARAGYLRKLFLRLSDEDLDAVVDALRAAGLRETIVAFGDIDFPTPLARRLLRHSPSLLRLLPKAVGAWLGPGGALAPNLDLGPRRNA